MPNETFIDGTPQIVPTGSPTPPSSGYLSGSYYGNESAKIQEAQAQEQNDANTISELSQKLGVDPNSLGVSPDVPTADTDDKQTVDPDFLAKFNTEEGQRFRQQFKDYVGVDVVEAFNTVQNAAKLTAELEAWRQGLVVQQETQQLRQEWGNEFDALMPEVKAYFNNLPDNQKAALDNLDGARMIAALIRQQKSAQMRGQGNVPSYVNGNVRTTANRGGVPTIRMSEMVTWSGAELDRRMGDVMRAKQAGTFINDL